WAARANGLAVGAHVRRAAARLGFHEPVHYTFVPQSAWFAGAIGEALLVYHASDEYAQFDGADVDAILALERQLLAAADVYVACSQPLRDHKFALHGDSVLVRHGVEHAHFARALDPTTIVPAAAALPRPIVGFIGLVAEWVDLA